MKKGNPWVSISDLLSSIVLVLLLLFVMAVIIPKMNQNNQRMEMMQQINSALKDYQDKGQVKIHVETGMLEFTSVTFPSGSAELSPDMNILVNDLANKLKQYMDKNPLMEILIEGHTDPAVISQVMNNGGYFENNIQLSTLRAANVRTSLLGFMGEAYADRIGVAGYGETRLKNKVNPMSQENRRIEIRILWNGKKDE